MNKEEVCNLYNLLNKINYENKPFNMNILGFNFSLGQINVDYTFSSMLRDLFYKRKEEFEKALLREISFCISYYDALYYTIKLMSYCFNANIDLDKKIIYGNKLELE